MQDAETLTEAAGVPLQLDDDWSLRVANERLCTVKLFVAKTDSSACWLPIDAYTLTLKEEA
jgi:hypothetical protein